MFLIKFKMGREGNFLNLIKGIFEPTVYIIQIGNISAFIPPREGFRKIYLILPLLFQH